jgi:HEAT repeat protein
VSAILLCVLLPCSSLAWQAPATYDGKNAAHWVDQLSSGNARTRWLAAYALGRIAPQDAAAVDALAQRIRDDEGNVRRYSIYALGRIGPAAKSAAPKLAKVVSDLADGNDPVIYKFYRRGAVRALGDIRADDETSRSVLAAALEDKDLVLRVDAALALLKIGPHPGAVQTLGKAITGDDAQARYQATAGLEQIGGAAKLLGGALMRALRSEDADVRRSAGRAFGAIGHEAIVPVARLLSDPSPRTRASAVAAIGWCGEMTRRNVLSDPTAAADEITAAEKAVRDVAVPALVTLLGDKNASVGRASSVALARIGPLALPALVKSLHANSPRVRTAAEASLDVLAPSLAKTSLGSPRMQAIKAAVLSDVVTAIAHADVEVRYQAVRLFAILAYGREAGAAETPLREAIKDPDSRVRGYASRGLRQLQSKPLQSKSP